MEPRRVSERGCEHSRRAPRGRTWHVHRRKDVRDGCAGGDRLWQRPVVNEQVPPLAAHHAHREVVLQVLEPRRQQLAQPLDDGVQRQNTARAPRLAGC